MRQAPTLGGRFFYPPLYKTIISGVVYPSQYMSNGAVFRGFWWRKQWFWTFSIPPIVYVGN